MLCHLAGLLLPAMASSLNLPAIFLRIFLLWHLPTNPAGSSAPWGVAQPAPAHPAPSGLGGRRCYVEAQERELLATLEGLIAEETWAPAELDGGGGGGAGVLRSATALFAVIKTSLLRCSKYITRGPALLQLMNTFQVRPVMPVPPFNARAQPRRRRHMCACAAGPPGLHVSKPPRLNMMNDQGQVHPAFASGSTFVQPQRPLHQTVQAGARPP